MKYERDDLSSEWQIKGATLSDKTARKEYGLTQEEIVKAIRAEKLQVRQNAIYGNVFLRLLRREVEALVESKHGASHLAHQRAKTELSAIKSEIRKLKKQLAELEKRKTLLESDS